MSRIRTRINCGLAVIAVCLSASFARAQDSGSIQVVPPKLVQFVAPQIPPQTPNLTEDAEVVVSITVDRTGHVSRVEIVRPFAPTYDEAAIAAARAFSFEPAQRNGSAVGARILYKFTFHAKKEEQAPAAKADPPLGPAHPPAVPQQSPPSVPEASKPASDQTNAPVEVKVRGTRSEANRLRASAEAVRVVDTRRAREQSRDLGEVLAAVEGVAVRRSGGLGSTSRFSLNGLYDQQIRFFFDGIPLDVAGGAIGVANIPVNLVERVEIYRGVIPVRFGADALGGAVNLVAPERMDDHIGISFQRGSFGTYRATVAAQVRHRPSGFFAGAHAWLDDTRNDYFVDVEIPDLNGRIKPATVRRFHDAYWARGAVVSLGLLDRPFAKRLSLHLFGSGFGKEIQHDVAMTRPFGEARQSGGMYGGTLRYDQPLTKSLSLGLVASGSLQSIRFEDLSDWNFDWYGRRTGRRNRAGELFREPRDTYIEQQGFFGRAGLQWHRGTQHAVRFASSARVALRSGTEKGIKGPNGIDPLAGQRHLSSVVTGLEYEFDALQVGSTEVNAAEDHRLQNIAFVKHYAYQAKAKDVLVQASLESLDTTGQRFGLGDSFRFRLTKPLSMKASYELATRIPSVDELFGDGLYVVPNVQLEPETSHNANAGIVFDASNTSVGVLTAEAHGFLRSIRGLIAATPDTSGVQYKNIAGARALGVETAVKWMSPARIFSVEANATWQDVRNDSNVGPFAKFDGERIPNRPWLFANWSARAQFRNILGSHDALAPFYFGRFVYEFYRNWESIGNPQFKAIVPTQIVHSLGLSYSTQTRVINTVTFEVDNVTDGKVYDFFGVQRPGRSFSIKITSDL